MNIIKRILPRLFKPKSYLLDDKYEIIPAFDLDGVTYYMHKDPLNTAVGRGLTSMMFMEELLMRCDVAYLREYCAAVRVIFSDPKKIDILKLAQITTHLEERVNFLAALPEHVYKMASIVFFDPQTESAYVYNQQAGAEKVKKWQASEGMYDFFLQTPLKDLMPFLMLPDQNSESYLAVQDKISNLHIKVLHEVLSNQVSETVRMS